jgi:hypothetical protein
MKVENIKHLVLKSFNQFAWGVDKFFVCRPQIHTTRIVKNAGTTLLLFRVLELRAGSILTDFSWHLFSPANSKKGFYTGRPPKPLVIR